jgi:23S rRNA pseudouridine1911/1915/1917 synthase
VDDEWEVPAALEGERADRALAIVTGLSRQAVTELFEAGSVSLGGRVVRSRSRRVHAGERVKLQGGAPRLVEGPPEPDPMVAVAVVWQDEDVIVIDKPAGLVVHPGAGHRGGTLVNGLLATFPDLAVLGGDRPGIVHRLDKGTSGLMVVARTEPARESLSDGLANRKVIREYLALVLGTLGSDSGLVDAPLGRSDNDPTRIRVQTGGRQARTRYRVEFRFEDPRPTTLVRCRLETGRTHQIRVHMASIGHPVVGDQRYGGGRWDGLDRPFLHATTLAFDHPRHGERMEYSSPLPRDLESVLATISHGG